MTLIADASSLILLAKSTILSKLLEKNKLIIPERVYVEVMRGKEKAMFDAFLIEKLVKEKKIKVEKINGKVKEKIKELFGLWAGEGEVISLALKNKQPIITDDKKCLNVAKAAGIKNMTTLDIVIALLEKKSIDKEKALQALNTLEEFGWYKKEIIKIYKEKIK